jgi:hypothetical protein
MGVKFALPPSTASMPTHVEGVELFKVPRSGGEGFDGIDLRVRFWDGATELGARIVSLYAGRIVAFGGTVPDWDAIKAFADNPSDYDDVTEALKDNTWGVDLLWAGWYGTIGI